LHKKITIALPLIIQIRDILYRFCIIGIKPGIVFVFSYYNLSGFGSKIAIGFTCANTLATTLGFYFYRESFKSKVSKKYGRSYVHKMFVNFVYISTIIASIIVAESTLKIILFLIAIEFLIHEQGRFILYLDNRANYLKFYFSEYSKIIIYCLLLYTHNYYVAVILFQINIQFWNKEYINILRYDFFYSNIKNKFPYFVANIRSNFLFFVGGIISKGKVNIDRFALLIIPQFGIDSYLTSVIGASCAVLIDTTILLKWRENLKKTNFKFSLKKLDVYILLKVIIICISVIGLYLVICWVNNDFWKPLIFFPVIIAHCLNTFSMIFEEILLWKKNGKIFITIQVVVLIVSSMTVIATFLTNNPIYVSFNSGFCFLILLLIYKLKYIENLDT
jgi:hypothetical protein